MRMLTEAEHEDLLAARRERDRLHALINTPELINFRDAVVLEAAHQREHKGGENDAGKTPADWFWLVGYLAGRALEHHKEAERLAGIYVPSVVPSVNEVFLDLVAHHREKAVHHTITAAAALANWHAAVIGAYTGMRPGCTPEALGPIAEASA